MKEETKRMKVAAVILARMGSTRLERKVLRDLSGLPLVAHTIRRARRFPGVAGDGGIVMAIPVGDAENELAETGYSQGAEVFRGSEDDVLSRLIGAGESAGADVVYRVTADNPLVDLGVVTVTWENFLKGDCDYCVMDGTPLGTTAELMTMDSLRRAYEIADTDRLREHPTLAFYENPEKFKMRLIPAPEKWNRPQWRFTVDTETDLKLVESILQNLGIDATLDRIVPFLDSNSAIAGMNSDVAQAGWRTLKEQKDRIGHV